MEKNDGEEGNCQIASIHKLQRRHENSDAATARAQLPKTEGSVVPSHSSMHFYFTVLTLFRRRHFKLNPDRIGDFLKFCERMAKLLSHCSLLDAVAMFLAVDSCGFSSILPLARGESEQLGILEQLFLQQKIYLENISQGNTDDSSGRDGVAALKREGPESLLLTSRSFKPEYIVLGAQAPQPQQWTPLGVDAAAEHLQLAMNVASLYHFIEADLSGPECQSSFVPPTPPIYSSEPVRLCGDDGAVMTPGVGGSFDSVVDLLMLAHLDSREDDINSWDDILEDRFWCGYDTVGSLCGHETAGYTTILDDNY